MCTIRIYALPSLRNLNYKAHFITCSFEVMKKYIYPQDTEIPMYTYHLNHVSFPAGWTCISELILPSTSQNKVIVLICTQLHSLNPKGNTKFPSQGVTSSVLSTRIFICLYTLHIHSLRHNKIGVEGVTSLSSGLKYCTSLQTLK